MRKLLSPAFVFILLLSLGGCGGDGHATLVDKINGRWSSERKGVAFHDHHIQMNKDRGEVRLISPKITSDEPAIYEAEIVKDDDDKKAGGVLIRLINPTPEQPDFYVRYIPNDDGTLTAELLGTTFTLTRKP